MTDFQAVLFDKDGTLFDFHKTWGNWSRTFLIDLARGDLDHAKTLAQAVGFELESSTYDDDSLLVSATPNEISEALMPHLPGATPTSVITLMNSLTASVPQVEATPLIPLLKTLKSRRLALGVVTNDAVFPARQHLEKAGVLDFFDLLLGCDSGYAPKPEPDMLRTFCEVSDVPPTACLMVGDSLHDMVAGKAAGMTTVGVLTGTATGDQLASVADVVLPSIAALPHWLDAEMVSASAA